MARFFKPRQSRAEKITDQLQKVASDPNFQLVGSRGGMAAVKAVANFLASFGSKVARLTKTAKGQLLQQDYTQDQQMRETAIDKLQATSKREIKNALDRYAQGKIDKVALRATLQSTLKRQALTAAIIGVRGVGNLTDNVLTAVKRQLSVQLAYLDGFLETVDNREVTPRGRARAAQYANASWAISQTAARQFNLDTSGVSAVQLEEKRRLGGSEHCEDCLDLAEGDWEPFGSLPVPGQGTVCGSNCRCTLEVRPVQESTKQQSLPTSENPISQG